MQIDSIKCKKQAHNKVQLPCLCASLVAARDTSTNVPGILAGVGVFDPYCYTVTNAKSWAGREGAVQKADQARRPICLYSLRLLYRACYRWASTPYTSSTASFKDVVNSQWSRASPRIRLRQDPCSSSDAPWVVPAREMPCLAYNERPSCQTPGASKLQLLLHVVEQASHPRAARLTDS